MTAKTECDFELLAQPTPSKDNSIGIEGIDANFDLQTNLMSDTEMKKHPHKETTTNESLSQSVMISLAS